MTLLMLTNSLLEVNCFIEANIHKTLACAIDLLLFKGL